MPTRIPSTGLVLLAAAALAGGCKKPAARTKPTPADGGTPPVAAIASPGGATTAPGPTPGDGRGAEGFARDFLRAVNDGTATPAMLTPQFKRVIAEPVFESDRTLGHSDDGAAGWLAQLKGKLAGAVVGPAFPGSGPDAAGFAGVVGADPAKRTRYALRAVKAGGGWQADYLVVSADAGGKLEPSPAGPAGFAAVAFLDALLAKDDRLAEALMTPALKSKLAPPFDSDKARGFSPGILSHRLADLRGSATGYTVTKAEGPVVAVGLTAAGAAKPVPVTLKFAPGERAWDWRVDDIDSK